jgi:transposase
MLIINPKSKPFSYFECPSSTFHRQYLAMRRFYHDGLTAEEVAKESGYAVSTVYSMARNFKENILKEDEDPFFKEENKSGRKPIDRKEEVEETVINLRKKYFSVPDIQIAMDALGFKLTLYTIEKIITDAGFARLPRRDKQFKNEVISSFEPGFIAPKAAHLHLADESFSTQLAGLLCAMPFIAWYGIDKIICQSHYPETKDINKLSSILSFVALKMSNAPRYSADDVWCMDRGMGLFAGLNVLPKTAWFSSYSSRVTREMNISFLKSLQSIWRDNGLLSDTINLDFTAIPYWGDTDPFENNWSGKRNKALASIQAVLAQDPETGILCYGDTTVRHDNESDVILEFLDFYHRDTKIHNTLKYLVFDSRFTTYQNLNKLNLRGIKFITIRRRSKALVSHIDTIDYSRFSKIRIEKENGKGRTVTVFEEYGPMKDYDGDIRHVYIRDKEKAQPAVLITNDFTIPLQKLVQKYGRRWLVETEISEHIDFFHLNRNSSGIVIKVDFDLTMTILAHNLYRLFCKDFDAYSHCEALTLFDKFISAPGSVDIADGVISVKLKKKRTLPVLLEQMKRYSNLSYPWLNDYKISFAGDSTT